MKRPVMTVDTATGIPVQEFSVLKLTARQIHIFLKENVAQYAQASLTLHQSDRSFKKTTISLPMKFPDKLILLDLMDNKVVLDLQDLQEERERLDPQEIQELLAFLEIQVHLDPSLTFNPF